jgi:hypothetical protein
LSPRDGEHYQHLNLSRRFPILQKAREVPGRLRYPNGRTLPVHDAWAREREGSATTETGPLLFPALGHARLGRGRGDDQFQVYLHFSGGYGHDPDTGSESRPNDGDLRLYVPGDETFQAVEASAPRAYPGLTRDYRRNGKVVDRAMIRRARAPFVVTAGLRKRASGWPLG